MPHNITAMPRTFNCATMSANAARVTAGSVPRSASLAPSSTMTACVPSGTDQSSRSRPPEEVSPETPALTISTAMPLAFNAFCSLAGNASEPDKPNPALKESPSTTILIGAPLEATEDWAKAGPAAINNRLHTSMCLNREDNLSTTPPEVPYDQPMDSLIEPSSLSGLAPDSISISNVNLSLGSGAARVHILKDISP